MAPVEKTDHQQRPENQKRAKDSYGAGLPPVYFIASSKLTIVCSPSFSS
jgi:hypothetical protein